MCLQASRKINKRIGKSYERITPLFMSITPLPIPILTGTQPEIHQLILPLQLHYLFSTKLLQNTIQKQSSTAILIMHSKFSANLKFEFELQVALIHPQHLFSEPKSKTMYVQNLPSQDSVPELLRSSTLLHFFVSSYTA